MKTQESQQKSFDSIQINRIHEKIPSFYKNIYYFDELDSTNQWLKQHHCKIGDVVIANMQTNGRGRNGRSFFSPKNKGIYISFLIQPKKEDFLKITALCAISLVKTIQNNYSLQPQIKWINDIIIENKKVAGILCEGLYNYHSKKIDKMIIGVGINVHSYKMPNELHKIAGCIEDYGKFVPREKIIIDFLNTFYNDYQYIHDTSTLQFYKQHSYLLHQEIDVYENNTHYKAFVKDILDDFQLLIEVNHQEKILQSGEVSIRKTNQQHT